MDMTSQTLADIARDGSKSASTALSKLSESDVTISTSSATVASVKESTEKITAPSEHGTVVYSEIIKGMPGLAILQMSREDALIVIDLLNQEDIGTTGILKDIDRSAIKETLNILANSYITSLAHATGVSFMVGAPNLITANRLAEVTGSFLKRADPSDCFSFDVTLTMVKHKIQMKLFILLHKQ